MLYSASQLFKHYVNKDVNPAFLKLLFQCSLQFTPPNMFSLEKTTFFNNFLIFSQLLIVKLHLHVLIRKINIEHQVPEHKTFILGNNLDHYLAIGKTTTSGRTNKIKDGTF